MLLQALCIISYPSVNSNLSCIRKLSIQVKIDNFLSRVTWKFEGWPWKTIGRLFFVTSSFVHHFVAIGEFKLELQSRNAQSGSNLMIFYLRDLDLWPWPFAWTSLWSMDITLVIGNNSWKFHDDTMMGTLSKRCHRQTDGQTEIAILKAAWSQLKITLKVTQELALGTI